MHIIFILYSYYIHIIFILYSYYIHIIFILYSFYIHIKFISYSYYIHIIFILYSYYIHIIFILYSYYPLCLLKSSFDCPSWPGGRSLAVRIVGDATRGDRRPGARSDAETTGRDSDLPRLGLGPWALALGPEAKIVQVGGVWKMKRMNQRKNMWMAIEKCLDIWLTSI